MQSGNGLFFVNLQSEKSFEINSAFFNEDNQQKGESYEKVEKI